MALLHEATLSPSKPELIEPWLRSRPWWDGVADRGPVGAFRLDDVAGQVGLECFLYGSASGSTLFVPVTYRGAPLAGAESQLIGTMAHSVLGTRYVYDACADPVFASTVLTTIRVGGTHAELLLRHADGSQSIREPNATARGEGAPDVPAHDPAQAVTAVDEPDRTIVSGDGWQLTVMRRLGDAPQGPALIGSFEGGADLRLAVVAG